MCMAITVVMSLFVSVAVSAIPTAGAPDARPMLSMAPPQGMTAPGFGTAAAVALEAADGGAGSSAPVSALDAGASSLLLPGLGEQRLGHTLRAKVFFGLEAVAWISIGSSLWMGYSREEAYKDYAVAYAEVLGTDHPDDFYKTIGQFMSNDGPGGYNESVRIEARDLYYPNVEAMEAYSRDHAMTGDEGWQWRTNDAYARYGVLRDGSRYAYRVALYCVVAAVALRIVSAADAVRLARIEGRPSAPAGSMSLGVEQKSHGIAFYLHRSF